MEFKTVQVETTAKTFQHENVTGEPAKDGLQLTEQDGTVIFYTTANTIRIVAVPA